MTPGLAGCVGGVLAGSSVYVLLFSPEGLSQFALDRRGWKTCGEEEEDPVCGETVKGTTQ